jgi:hypothetical protein
MTDLVILYGVRWLLKRAVFPFDSYLVEYGNDDKQGFDIRATSGGSTLIGEAFNVAPSFFQGKKGAMLKKLRQPAAKADFKLIMFNHDAVTPQYVPKTEEREFLVVVRVGTDEAQVIPDLALHTDAGHGGNKKTLKVSMPNERTQLTEPSSRLSVVQDPCGQPGN